MSLKGSGMRFKNYAESQNVDHYHARMKTRLERIVELDPTDKVALFWLGDFQHKLENYEKALDYFDKIIVIR